MERCDAMMESCEKSISAVLAGPARSSNRNTSRAIGRSALPPRSVAGAAGGAGDAGALPARVSSVPGNGGIVSR